MRKPSRDAPYQSHERIEQFARNRNALTRIFPNLNVHISKPQLMLGPTLDLLKVLLARPRAILRRPDANSEGREPFNVRGKPNTCRYAPSHWHANKKKAMLSIIGSVNSAQGQKRGGPGAGTKERVWESDEGREKIGNLRVS
eukprot:2638226-Rhodomonas_salina.2